MSQGDTKTVVVTGCTRGLGRAMAEQFIKQGHTVVGCGRSQQPIEELCAQFGKPHSFSVIDIADDRSVADWAEKIVTAYGSPDLLCNNAAIINANAALWDVPAEDFSEVIDVNIKGVANVIRHFVPAMIERGSGVIVNFSSGWGRSTSADVAPYCATKWAIEGMTQAMAQELPEGLAAVPLNPGIINTDMLQSCFGVSASDFPDAIQWGEAAVPFLLGLNASHNGEPLTVPLS